MAVINKTGITNGGTIQAEHVTRAIDALSGVSTDTIIASGSFTGSLVGTVTGTGSYASQALSSSFATSASFAVSASSAISSSQALSSSFATSASVAATASFALNASSFPFTGSARITGSLGVTGSLSVNGTITTSGITTLQNNLIITGSTTANGTITIQQGIYAASKTSIVDLGEITNGTGYFQLPLGASVSPVAGAMYWDDDAGILYVYQGSSATWISINA